MILKGLHGTSKRKAEIIRASSFRSGEGRIGRAIYFWRDSPLAKHLAEGWFNSLKARRVYQKDPLDQYPECAVICVDIRCDDLEYLNLETSDIKDRLMDLAQRKGVDISNDAVCVALYSMLVEGMEQELHTKIKVMEVRVAPPEDRFVPQYQIKLFGAPLSYVVRDKSCIIITKIV